jgi:hypothetical protein
VLNLKTAKTLGLTFPPEILLQATEVIQYKPRQNPIYNSGELRRPYWNG